MEKSNAGEMKLATMLMPIVAMVNVNAPNMMAKVLSIRATVWTGSVINSPNTGSVSDAADDHQDGEHQEVDRQAQEVALLDRGEDLP